MLALGDAAIVGGTLIAEIAAGLLHLVGVGIARTAQFAGAEEQKERENTQRCHAGSMEALRHRRNRDYEAAARDLPRNDAVTPASTASVAASSATPNFSRT